MGVAGTFGSGAVGDTNFSWRELSLFGLGKIGSEINTSDFEAGVRRSLPRLLLNHADPKANVSFIRLELRPKARLLFA